MTFNLSKIMQHAWAMARADLWSRRLPASELRGLFRQALRAAWACAKSLALRNRAAREAAKVTPINREIIAREILCIECKDRLFSSDFQRLEQLRQMLAEAQRFHSLAA